MVKEANKMKTQPKVKKCTKHGGLLTLFFFLFLKSCDLGGKDRFLNYYFFETTTKKIKGASYTKRVFQRKVYGGFRH